MLLAALQLVVALFLARCCRAAVGQEKDRKTLVLLLLTRLSNSELVLGKLSAALLQILLFIVVSIPILLLTAALGGVSYGQVTRVVVVTLFATIASGSLGSCVALWRDKTFQALSATILALTIWLGFWEAVGYGLLNKTWFGVSTDVIASAASPWRAILLAAKPDDFGAAASLWEGVLNALTPVWPFLAVSAAFTILVNMAAIMMVRVWNPSREILKNTTIEQDTWRQEAIQARLDRKAAERRERETGVRDDNPYNDLTDNIFAVEESLDDVEARGGRRRRGRGSEVLAKKSGVATEESIETGVAPRANTRSIRLFLRSAKRVRSGTTRSCGAKYARARTAARPLSCGSSTSSCSF